MCGSTGLILEIIKFDPKERMVADEVVVAAAVVREFENSEGEIWRCYLSRIVLSLPAACMQPSWAGERG